MLFQGPRSDESETGNVFCIYGVPSVRAHFWGLPHFDFAPGEFFLESAILATDVLSIPKRKCTSDYRYQRVLERLGSRTLS